MLSFFRDKAQVNLISVWIAEETPLSTGKIVISNASSFPITNVILSVVNIQLTASSGLETPSSLRKCLDSIPPGVYFTIMELHHGMGFRSGIEMAFTDRKHKHWVRRGDGFLSALSVSPAKYYNIPIPISWEFPLEESLGTNL